MSLMDHAKRELEIAGYDLNDTEDGPNRWIAEGLLELVDKFSKQGHSGFSASYCTSALEKLLRFEPLTPLKGEGEFVEVSDGVFQNNRCSNIFAEGADGKNAYTLDGVVWVDKDGCAYTNNKSRKRIKFPYTPVKPTYKHDSIYSYLCSLKRKISR